MVSDVENSSDFYEEFWADAGYQQSYAFDSAVRDRFPAIQQVWGSMKLPKRVLDYGCGNGVLSYWLHCNGFGGEITGVDVSNTGIKNANSAFARPGLKYEHVSFLKKDGMENKFDVVVSSHVLEHIPNPESALKDLLELGEWFVIEVPLEKCLLQDLIYALKRKERSENALGHVNFWNKATFKKFLADNKLIVVRDYCYASAPFSPYNSAIKRFIERVALGLLGLTVYAKLMATHYIVLARKR